MRSPTKLRRNTGPGREARIVIAAGGIAVTLVVLLVVYEATRSYRRVIADGHAHAGNLALVLEEQTRRTVQSIDFTLEQVAEVLRRTPGWRDHDEAVEAYMRERLAALPFVRALFVVGPDGFITQDTDRDTPRLNLADRDYFAVHAGKADRGLFIGSPLRSRSTQIGSPWFLSASRRNTRPDGQFGGVLVAAVEPEFFAQFYANLDVGPQGVVSLIHRSGLVIARHPEHPQAVGQSLSGQKLFEALQRADSGSHTETSKVDGVVRLYGYRTVPPLPLVVSVGIPRTALLEQWRAQLASSAAAALLLVIVLVGGSVMLLRQQARTAAIRERLQETERLEALGRMVSSIAHDFKNILYAIKGSLELLRLHVPETAASADLDTAERGSARGNEMVTQLLRFARRAEGEAADQDICAVVRDFADLLQQAARPCRLEIRLPDSPLRCRIDCGAFERGLMNLVTNARDASPATSPIVIALEACYIGEDGRWPDLGPGPYACCKVTDRGHGIPPEVMRHVFEPFFTTKEKGKGTGLGLSQVFGFARASHGDVTIESTVGAGTTVTLMLPLVGGS